ncbi:DinB family protein [Candidatus Gottesmanbacteria bacterium]|nr:DinB family protein [Candidatus Gottesmanbacteria bacterium]
MFITKNTLAELTFYLKSFRKILRKDHLPKPLFPDGVTIGQVAYHTAESANYWLKVHILKEEYPRDRDSEFIDKHSLENILNTLDQAMKLCQEVAKRKIRLDEKLKTEREVYSMGFKVTNHYEVLQHVTSHTAEHFGHISVKIKEENT